MEIGQVIPPLVVAVCGVKNVGKTTFLTNLIPLLRAKGLSVAVVKSDAHDFSPDVPGTDSFKLRAAGAGGVAIFSPKLRMVIKDEPKAKAKDAVAAELIETFSDFQIVLLEGGKNSPYPKIELLRSGVSKGPVGLKPHLAYCADGPFESLEAPVFALDDYQGVADLLVARLTLSGP